MATRAESSPLVQLLDALSEEGIPFMLAGMSAANLQGVLAATIDVDIWIGLASRQYMRVANLCHRLRATLRSPNKVYLRDDTPVDFIYEVTGLAPFQREISKAKWLRFHGRRVPVMSLEQIRRSKLAAARDKDKLHVLLINQVLRCKRAAAARSKPGRPLRPGRSRSRRRG